MNGQNTFRARKLIRLALFVGAVLAGIYLAYKLAFYVLPFLIAFIISTLIEPLVSLLTKKLKFSRRLASAVALLFVVAAFGFIVVIAISRLVSEIVSISRVLPDYFTDLYNNIDILIRKGTDIYLGLPKEVTNNIENVIANLSQSLAKITTSFFTGILNTAISVPQALIFTLVTILSTYFIASDRERIAGYFAAQVPESWINKFRSIRNDMFSALFGYIRAQLILMTITFTELYTGFLVIGLKHPLILALMISIVDALPILGTGGILVPWSIYEFLTGDIRLGVSILLIYVIVLIVRQMIEPKVLGQQIGVHPLLTLIAMYTGLQLLGVIGLIIGPVSLLLLKNIFSGFLKNKPLKEILKTKE